MNAGTNDQPLAWATLEQALRQRRPLQARYHDHQRVLCPHALGWKHGRAKVLAYQAAGTTSDGALPQDPCQRWRSMFVEEVIGPVIVDGPWETADNHAHASNCFDTIAIEVPY